MYYIAEIDKYGREIGIVDLNNIDITGGMSFYWNKILKNNKQKTSTIYSYEVEKIYRILCEKFSDKEFEIKYE